MLFILTGAALIGGGATAWAQKDAATNSAPAAITGTDEKSFRLIVERNIFNQNRSARSNSRSRSDDGERSRTSKADTFSLVGTMIYEKGNVAFFVGSNSDYQKPLKPGDTLAGYKVEAVEPNLVTLEKDGKQVELKVGMQMKRQNGGEWKISDEAPVYSASSSSSSGTSSSSGGGSPGAGSSDDEEILKRLMEKRAKELDK
jgi:hypothetical protein